MFLGHLDIVFCEVSVRSLASFLLSFLAFLFIDL